MQHPTELRGKRCQRTSCQTGARNRSPSCWFGEWKGSLQKSPQNLPPPCDVPFPHSVQARFVSADMRPFFIFFLLYLGYVVPWALTHVQSHVPTPQSGYRTAPSPKNSCCPIVVILSPLHSPCRGGGRKRGPQKLQ